MMKPQSRSNLTEGNVFKQLLLFSMPLLIGNLLQTLHQLINAFWVGQFIGPNALAAIAVSGPVVFVLLAFIFGFVIATSTMVAQYKGANDEESLQKTIDTSTKGLMIGGIILTFIAIALSPTILRWLQTPANIFDMAHDYLWVLFSGLVLLLGYNYLSAVMRGLGDSKTPLYFLVIATVVNVVLDPLLIVGVGPIPALGVAGAALATVIAQGLAFFLAVIYIKRKKMGFTLRFIKAKIYSTFLKQMVKMGMPAGLQQVIVSMAVVVVMGVVNTQGATVVAGFGTASRLDAFIFLPTMSLGMAVSAMVGQNIGAGKWDRVSAITRSGMALAFVITGILSTIVFFFGEALMNMFTSDQAVILVGDQYLRTVAFTFIPFSFMFIITGVLRGAGDMMWSMILTATSLWIFRVPLVIVLSNWIGTEGIWIGIGLSFVLAYILAGSYYLTGNWKKKALVKKEDEKGKPMQLKEDIQEA